jgi:hypothetical protein
MNLDTITPDCPQIRLHRKYSRLQEIVTPRKGSRFQVLGDITWSQGLGTTRKWSVSSYLVTRYLIRKQCHVKLEIMPRIPRLIKLREV